MITKGAVVKAIPAQGKSVALVFTADEFGEGLSTITQILQKEQVQGSFFFTGRFYRNPAFTINIQELIKGRHYLGPHSDQHLLYADWKKRDSLLVSYQQFNEDLNKNLGAMETLGIRTELMLFYSAIRMVERQYCQLDQLERYGTGEFYTWHLYQCRLYLAGHG